MTQEIYVMPTMDCEPPKPSNSALANELSGSGPANYEESLASIRAYVEINEQYGFTPSLFVHPEIARNHAAFLAQLADDGVCLGLHLHPYKFDRKYEKDVGGYSLTEQEEMLAAASEKWAEGLGERPKYFRGGKYSANDNTFRVLAELGFESGSLSIPGRVLPANHAVWAGAAHFPHRADLDFRQLPGDSDFVEFPTLGDVSRPIEGTGDAGESQGYEWLYVASQLYDHEAVVRNLVSRFIEERPTYPVVVINTHNDMTYEDETNYARRNLEAVLEYLTTVADSENVSINGRTIDVARDEFIAI